MDGTKQCSMCKEVLPLDAFGKRKEGHLGRLSACRPCRNANAKRKREADPETYRAKAREYAKNNRAMFTAATRKSRAKNPEKYRQYGRDYRAANRGAILAKERAYREAHPDLIRQWKERRRAAELGAWDGSFIHYPTLRRQRPDCYLCGRKLSGKVQLDHIFPLSRGGAHTAANLLPTHASCNLRKNWLLLSELDWYTGPTNLGVISHRRQLVA